MSHPTVYPNTVDYRVKVCIPRPKFVFANFNCLKDKGKDRYKIFGDIFLTSSLEHA